MLIQITTGFPFQSATETFFSESKWSNKICLSVLQMTKSWAGHRNEAT